MTPRLIPLPPAAGTAPVDRQHNLVTEVKVESEMPGAAAHTLKLLRVPTP